MKFAYLFFVLILLSCSTSKVGDWSRKDLRKAEHEINGVFDELVESFGEVKAALFVDCYLEKIENTFQDFASANSDYAGCEKLATECAENLPD